MNPGFDPAKMHRIERMNATRAQRNGSRAIRRMVKVWALQWKDYRLEMVQYRLRRLSLFDSKKVKALGE